MAKSVRRLRAGSARGFTLLELIIVLVVLAALAALVIPTLGFVRDQANYATAAAGAAEVLNNIELFKSASGKYPNRMDTLLDTNGALYEPLAGMGPPSERPFVVDSTNASTIAYYFQHGAGVTQFVNYTPATVHPAADAADVAGGPGSGSAPTAYTNGVVTTSLSAVALVNGATNANARRIIRAAYPNQSDGAQPRVPVKDDATGAKDHYLVAFGIGPRCGAVGSTLSSAPTWSATPEGKYPHYIAFFDAWVGTSGRGKVQLKLVTDPTFQTIARNQLLYKGTVPGDEVGVYPTPTGT